MRKVAVVLLVLVAAGALQSAAKYMFATEFMPYHAVVVGRSWVELDANTRSLLLAMMKVMGAGNLAIAAALLCFAYRAAKGERWAAWAALLTGACLWIPTLYVTLALRAARPEAQTPSGLTLAALVLLAAAAVLMVLAKAPQTDGDLRNDRARG